MRLVNEPTAFRLLATLNLVDEFAEIETLRDASSK